MLSFLFADSSEIVIEEDAKAGLPSDSKAITEAAIEVLTAIAETDFKTGLLQESLNQKLIEEMGQKPRNAFGPLRTAISGRRVSPPLFESMEILGKDQTLSRLKAFALSL
jgi:glutamyl-tRNA synthetase